MTSPHAMGLETCSPGSLPKTAWSSRTFREPSSSTPGSWLYFATLAVRQRERGVTFRVQLGTAPIVAMIFEVSGVLDELECVSTREEALRDAATPSDSQG